MRFQFCFCSAIAASVGLTGILTSALLIAVLTQKLMFRREEKYVHTFVLNIHLAKTRRVEAANVLKFGIKSWYLRRKNRHNTMHYLEAQRKLFRAIGNLQQVKERQRALVDNCVGLHELITTQRSSSDQLDETVQQMFDLKSELKRVDVELVNVQQTMNNIHTTLKLLLEKSTDPSRAIFL
jgi:hypothetical protein